MKMLAQYEHKAFKVVTLHRGMGVQSGNTAQWYVVYTSGCRKYKFQLTRIKTRIFVIIYTSASYFLNLKKM